MPNLPKVVEYVILCVVICLVWAVLSLPIVFYHLPVTLLDHGKSDREALNSSNTTSKPISGHNGDLVCSSSLIYNGTVCHNVLQQYRNCFSDSKVNSSVFVLPEKLSLAIEKNVSEKIEVVKLFAFSKECITKAVPLVCLYYYGPLCDSEKKSYRLSTAQCLEASTGVCKQEWEYAGSFVPNCHDGVFANETVLTNTCDFNQSKNYEISTEVNHSNCSLQCTENFFCKPGTNSCIPSCDWKEYHETTNMIIDVFIAFAAALGVVFGILTLISAAIRRKRLCTFPSVIILYQTAAALIIALFMLIGYMNRTGLYCRSNDLLDSAKNATPFCVISGIVTHYMLLHLTLWWICHTSIIFWKLRFPFQARDFEIENRMKYIHIACFFFCFLVSFVPIIVITLVDYRQRASGEIVQGTIGFGMTRFQPIICTAVNRDSVYYSLILPINVIIPFGVTLLILVVWVIQKNRGLKDADSKPTFKIGAAERKVFFILVYYVIVTLISLTGLTIVSRNVTSFTREVFQYFVCERKGYDPNHPCDRTKFEHLQQPGLVALSFVLLGIFPLINFIFTTNFSEIKEVIMKCCRRRQHEESESLISKGSLKPTKTSEMEMSSGVPPSE